MNLSTHDGLLDPYHQVPVTTMPPAVQVCHVLRHLMHRHCSSIRSSVRVVVVFLIFFLINGEVDQSIQMRPIVLT